MVIETWYIRDRVVADLMIKTRCLLNFLFPKFSSTRKEKKKKEKIGRLVIKTFTIRDLPCPCLTSTVCVKSKRKRQRNFLRNLFISFHFLRSKRDTGEAIKKNKSVNNVSETRKKGR